MNHCILMAEIIRAPQLRHTPDTQMAVAEMIVQFPGLLANDPPTELKVVGWGNLAQTIHDTYHEGDRVILEGRLTINSFDRPEGFKETRAELTLQRIHGLGESTIIHSAKETIAPSAPSDDVPPASDALRSTTQPRANTTTSRKAPPPPPTTEEMDDIPF